jgi:hypothetical protein
MSIYDIDEMDAEYLDEQTDYDLEPVEAPHLTTPRPESQYISIKIAKKTHERLVACRRRLSGKKKTTSRMIDLALMAWLQRRGLTYEQLVRDELSLLTDGLEDGQ